MRLIRTFALALIAACLLTLGACASHGGPHSVDGFQTYEKDGSLYVFEYGSEEAKEFAKSGEISKPITEHNGPGGMTMYAPNDGVLDAFYEARQ